MMKKLKSSANRIKSIVMENIVMILPVILLAASGTVFMILLTLHMYLDAVVFFLFGLGIYWYIRLLGDKTYSGFWYELENGVN